MENTDVNKERKITDAFEPAVAMLNWGQDYFPADHRAMLVLNYGFLRASVLGLREVRAAFRSFHGDNSSELAIQEAEACSSILKNTEAEAKKCLGLLGALVADEEKLEEMASALWDNFKPFYLEVPDINALWAIIAFEAPSGLPRRLDEMPPLEAAVLRKKELLKIQKLIAASGSTEKYLPGCELQHLACRAAWALAGLLDCISGGAFAKPPGDRWEIN